MVTDSFRNQAIKLSAIAKKGVGKMHSKWSPARLVLSSCSFLMLAPQRRLLHLRARRDTQLREDGGPVSPAAQDMGGSVSAGDPKVQRDDRTSERSHDAELNRADLLMRQVEVEDEINNGEGISSAFEHPHLLPLRHRLQRRV
eukprot:767529-Hanusia_phi.AAC.13